MKDRLNNSSNQKGNNMDSTEWRNELQKRTKTYALRIIKVYRALPKDQVAFVIGKQMLRSGTSVGAHYREASRARSVAEFISKIGGLLQELDETKYWLELLVEDEIVSAAKMKELMKETEELMSLFTKTMMTSRKSAKKR